MQKPLPVFQRREAAVRGRFFSADALPLWHSDDGKNKIQGQGAPCVGPNFFCVWLFSACAASNTWAIHQTF